MNTTLRMEARSLLRDIAATLPADLKSQPDLPELLVAGIGLRNGLSMLELNSILHNMSTVRFRLGLAKALSDTAVSVWYFNQLESFDKRFQNIMRERRGHALERVPAEAHSPQRSMHPYQTRALPAMPVAAVF